MTDPTNESGTFDPRTREVHLGKILDRLERNFSEVAKPIDHKVDRVCRTVERIETLMSGGSEPERGMIVRLDRVEQIVKARERFFWLVIGAVVTIGIAGLTGAAVWIIRGMG